jgi:hypothetical protein
MSDYTVTISGKEREDGEEPYTYVVSACSLDEAVERALMGHGHAFGLELESVVPGVPAGDCGYEWNDLRARCEKTGDAPIVESLQVRCHTPGTWSAGRDGIPVGCADINVVSRVYRKTINANHVIATIRHGSDQWEANARLISAAPDLLWALKEAVAAGDCGCDDPEGVIPCVYCLASAAVNKAEGQGR